MLIPLSFLFILYLLLKNSKINTQILALPIENEINRFSLIDASVYSTLINTS